MTRTACSIAVALAALTLNGCSMSPLRAFEEALEDAGIARFQQATRAPNDGRSVAIQVEGRTSSGWGAVVGPRRVLTVEHVVGGAQSVLVGTRQRQEGWVRAQVIERIPAEPEALVLLEVEVDEGAYGVLLGFAGFADEECYGFAPGGDPSQVVLAGGRYSRWRQGVLRPGDSGSPVVDADGVLVGLVTGRRGDAPVHTPIPAAFSDPVLAARLGVRSTRG